MILVKTNTLSLPRYNYTNGLLTAPQLQARLARDNNFKRCIWCRTRKSDTHSKKLFIPNEKKSDNIAKSPYVRY